MRHISINNIKAVYNALGALKDKVVFVGGATLSFYPDRQILEVRPTIDVDVIVEILNYASRVELEEKLRALGFVNDAASRVVCRYIINDIVVDIMPTDDPSIGFSNKWYAEGFKQAFSYTIDEVTTIKILSPSYFLSTKLEAFKSRGRGDGRSSNDFEDIVFVLENRKSIWNEMENAGEEVREYLKLEFTQLIKHPFIREWIDAHVERGSTPMTYYILQELEKFCK